jgi:hypothetical protein
MAPTAKAQAGKLTRRSLVPEGMQTIYDFPGNVLKPKEKTFGEFLYDSASGKIMSRTPKSWCKIITIKMPIHA